MKTCCKQNKNEWINVCGSNICRAFIWWGNNVYCTLFSFFYERKKGRKKKWRNERKREWKKKNLDPFSACFGKKRKKKKVERNILRNNQFSTEMKDSRTIFVLFLSTEEKKKKKKKYLEKKEIEKKQGGKTCSLWPYQTKIPLIFLFYLDWVTLMTCHVDNCWFIQ